MGTWAEGNFDNDSALDFVCDLAREVAEEMAPPEEVEDLDLVMAAVAVQKALVEHCHAPAPTEEEIQSLKDATLAIYDEQIDGLEPAADYKIARRKTIVDTFDQFLDILAK